jgi:protein-L-isoaspartate(D-aspartate) O-methyltransferase
MSNHSTSNATHLKAVDLKATDFAAARRTMVDGQLRTYDVTDQALLGAFLSVPRERFVAPAQAGIAYLDADIAVGRQGRRLLKPMVLAKLLQAAGIGPGDRVLDVGCATGYAAAVIAPLAGKVIALEEEPALVEEARRNLAGMPSVSVVSGPLAAGAPAEGPYDVILLSGAAEIVPPTLLSLLKDGGRLVGIVGKAPASQAMLFRSVGGEVSGRPIFDATGSLLPGFAKPAEFVF